MVPISKELDHPHFWHTPIKRIPEFSHYENGSSSAPNCELDRTWVNAGPLPNAISARINYSLCIIGSDTRQCVEEWFSTVTWVLTAVCIGHWNPFILSVHAKRTSDFLLTIIRLPWLPPFVPATSNSVWGILHQLGSNPSFFSELKQLFDHTVQKMLKTSRWSGIPQDEPTCQAA